MAPERPNGPARPERRRPPGRYGRAPSRRRRVAGYVAYAVVGALLVLGLLLFYATRDRASLRAQLRSFERTSDSAIRITFSVTKSPSEDARCTVRARGLDGSEVGAQEVEVLPDARAQRETVISVDLTTTRPAVSGELLGCRRIPSIQGAAGVSVDRLTNPPRSTRDRPDQRHHHLAVAGGLRPPAG